MTRMSAARRRRLFDHTLTPLAVVGVTAGMLGLLLQAIDTLPVG